MSTQQTVFPIYVSRLAVMHAEVTEGELRAIEPTMAVKTISLYPRYAEEVTTEVLVGEKMRSFERNYSTITFEEIIKELPVFWGVTEEKRVPLTKVRELMDKLRPSKVKLKRGTIKRLDENLIAEKTHDGKIILYEVVR
jgi:hypothetical protein